jgi:hypothetical protein
MKSPISHITIGGTKITVKVVDQEEWGNFYGDAKTITISKRAIQEGIFMQTLLHEMLHAAFFVSGITWAFDQNMEEAVVRAIENIYFPAVASMEQRSKRKR